MRIEYEKQAGSNRLENFILVFFNYFYDRGFREFLMNFFWVFALGVLVDKWSAGVCVTVRGASVTIRV